MDVEWEEPVKCEMPQHTERVGILWVNLEYRVYVGSGQETGGLGSPLDP